MAEKTNSVFISYRREASAFVAQAVYQDLSANGIDAFYDIESINTGQFDSIILSQIAARPYFVPILTPGTLDRCVQPSDWVLHEIDHALKWKRAIVPLYTPEFDREDIDKFLPVLLAAELKRYNSIEIPHRYFKYAMQDMRVRFLVPISIPTTKPVDNKAVSRLLQKAASLPMVTEKQLTAQEYFERGLARKDDSNAKLEDYNEAIRLNPDYPEAYNNRGFVRQIRGDIDGAIGDYSEAIRRNPRIADFYFNRGVAHYDQGNTDQALADYDKAIEINPRFIEALGRRSSVRYHIGDYKGAIKDYSEIIRLNPNDALAYSAFSNRGESHFAAGHYPEALSDFQSSIQVNPDNKYALAGLAITYHALGKRQEALVLWQKLLDQDKRYTQIDWVAKKLNWVPPLIEEGRKLTATL